MTTIAFEGFFCSKSEMFLGVSEKSATSDAATIEQQKSKIIIPMMPKSMLVSTVENNVKLGSGSKLN
ncbi:hypothetical protein GCM10028861_01950 [Flavobacterium koreense]